jgi:hypothetical protein
MKFIRDFIRDMSYELLGMIIISVFIACAICAVIWALM